MLNLCCQLFYLFLRLGFVAFFTHGVFKAQLVVDPWYRLDVGRFNAVASALYWLDRTGFFQLFRQRLGQAIFEFGNDFVWRQGGLQSRLRQHIAFTRCFDKHHVQVNDFHGNDVTGFKWQVEL